MTRNTTFVLSLLFLITARLPAAPAPGDPPIPIEHDVPQLFVDDALIDTQANLKRTLHQPKKDNGGNEPILSITDQYGGTPATLEANGTIVFDPKLKKWVMICLGCCTAQRKDPNYVRLYRFTSADALNWKPGGVEGSAFEHLKIDLADRASGTSATNTDLFSFCYDEADPEYPYKGWLWFANWEGGREGIYYVRSRDGRAWERGPQLMRFNSRNVDQDAWHLHGPSDVTIFSPQPFNNRYLALFKFTNRQQIGDGNSQRSRAYLFVDRLDQPVDLNRIERVALVPSAANANGDEPSDEYYASTAWRYGSVWLGGLKVWHRHGDYPYSFAGCAFLKFAVSRDGLNWKKVQFDNDDGVPEVWIPNGKEGGHNGHNDGGYMTEFSQGPIRIGDELIYYYGSSSWGKNHPEWVRITGGGIFRARLRPDGFVSLDAGTLTTKPLALNGSKLSVNAVGPVTVEVLGANDEVMNKASLSGDSLAHEIPLTDHSPARLRFTIDRGGRLYSFTTH